MLALDDPRWRTLAGGYREPYDPTVALHRLAARWDDPAAWEELWEELHHQGDVGEASYAAVVPLAEIAAAQPHRGWQCYGLAATIESQRHARQNPALPDWLAADYGRAWRTLLDLALNDLRTTDDATVVQSALACIALAKGLVRLGLHLADLDDSGLEEYLEDHHGWSEQYRDDLPPVCALGG